MKNEPVEKEIGRLRRQIDEIDEHILALINKRLAFAGKIGDLKELGGKSVMDDAREVKVIKHLISINKGPLPENSLRRIFYKIIHASREIQKPFP